VPDPPGAPGRGAYVDGATAAVHRASSDARASIKRLLELAHVAFGGGDELGARRRLDDEFDGAEPPILGDLAGAAGRAGGAALRDELVALEGIVARIVSTADDVTKHQARTHRYLEAAIDQAARRASCSAGWRMVYAAALGWCGWEGGATGGGARGSRSRRPPGGGGTAYSSIGQS